MLISLMPPANAGKATKTTSLYDNPFLHYFGGEVDLFDTPMRWTGRILEKRRYFGTKSLPPRTSAIKAYLGDSIEATQTGRERYVYRQFRLVISEHTLRLWFEKMMGRDISKFPLAVMLACWGSVMSAKSIDHDGLMIDGQRTGFWAIQPDWWWVKLKDGNLWRSN